MKEDNQYINPETGILNSSCPPSLVIDNSNLQKVSKEKSSPKVMSSSYKEEIKYAPGVYPIKEGKQINNAETGDDIKDKANSVSNFPASSKIQFLPFKLFIKNGEYLYARPNDIVLIESCDHLVKVYVAFNDKIRKTIRHNTLKDFLLQLPPDHFMRIGRFCAVNIQRLSGGNCNDQTFEFDFRVSIKLKHAISNAAFCAIGR